MSDDGNQRIAEIIYEKYGEGKSIGSLGATILQK
jgi:hypothetical protein